MILISNDQTPGSKKINQTALIRTLTVSTTSFVRTKEKFYGFGQTELQGVSNLIVSIGQFTLSAKCEIKRD